MKLTKTQRIALEFLAEVGPLNTESRHATGALVDLFMSGLAKYRFTLDDWAITKQGREALKEAK